MHRRPPTAPPHERSPQTAADLRDPDSRFPPHLTPPGDHTLRLRLSPNSAMSSLAGKKRHRKAEAEGAADGQSSAGDDGAPGHEAKEAPVAPVVVISHRLFCAEEAGGLSTHVLAAIREHWVVLGVATNPPDPPQVTGVDILDRKGALHRRRGGPGFPRPPGPPPLTGASCRASTRSGRRAPGRGPGAAS